VRAAVVALTAILAGCSMSPTVDMASTEYVQARRDTHSDITDASEAWICRGISVYEWMRRYGTPERAAGWQAICEDGKSLPKPQPSAALGIRG
jgi:hypothetical protein